MDFTSGVKQCESCSEPMRVIYNTCPRCGYFHGKESLINENKRKTKKEKVEN